MSNRGWITRRLSIEELNPYNRSFIARTCNRCHLKFSLDPEELEKPPAPRAEWLCSKCRKETGGWLQWLASLLTTR